MSFLRRAPAIKLDKYRVNLGAEISLGAWSAINPGSGNANVYVYTDGTMSGLAAKSVAGGTSGTFTGRKWKYNNLPASTYYMKANNINVLGGGLTVVQSSGTIGNWTQLSGTINWGTATAGNDDSADFQLHISSSSTGTPVLSGKGRTVGMNDTGGGGGGSGSYAKKVFTLNGGYDNQTITYAVGAAGAGNTITVPGTAGGSSNIKSGTFSFTTVTTNGGGAGTVFGVGAGGSVGTGGDTNTAGNAGGAGSTAVGGLGGLGVAGDTIFAFGAGTVSITGTSGQFTYNNTPPLGFTLTTDMYIRVSGTGSGNTGIINGYTNPSYYVITATNGSTTFTLGSVQTGVLTTTTGTTTGLTFEIFGYGGDGGEGGASQIDNGLPGSDGRIRFVFSVL